MTVNVDLLRRLSNAPGISGFEDDVQAIVNESLSASCDETWRDRLGNVIGVKRAVNTVSKGERTPRVVLAAHADEIGMLVKHISPEGFIRFAPVGGLRAAAITSQLVTIHGRKSVNGVIVPPSAPPTGTTEERPITLEGLMIDVGLPRDRVCELVEVGDPITFAQEFVQLNSDVYMGRNFDDRIGTYCLIETMNRMRSAHVDVYGVSTVQEELGVRGMPVAAYAIDADIGIALDGSLCQGAGSWADPYERTCVMGNGTGIYVMDRLTMGDKRLVGFLIDLCKKNNIPHQRNVGGGTDASALQRNKVGALATTVGAPVRYMHSTVQLCHDSDIEATISLLTTFLEHAHELLD